MFSFILLLHVALFQNQCKDLKISSLILKMFNLFSNPASFATVRQSACPQVLLETRFYQVLLGDCNVLVDLKLGSV